jgi:hypothetical protein
LEQSAYEEMPEMCRLLTLATNGVDI